MDVGRNIFSILEEKSRERVAAGNKVYNLFVGTPDLPPAPHIIHAVAEAALDPENYKYALIDMPELIAAVQRWYAQRYQVQLNPDEIMSIYGTQEGIAHIAWALCDPGDVILAPDPCYPIFDIGPRLAGAHIVHYALSAENSYLPDLGKLSQNLPLRTRAMIVSYPANPLGAVAPRTFYERLIEFAYAHDLLILHDNAYSEIIFDGAVGESFLSLSGAKTVGVEFNSLSKTYNLTGLRVSFLVGNAEVINKFQSIRSQIDYGMCRIAQYAAIAALDGPQEGVVSQRLEYQHRRDVLCGGLRRIGWNVPDAKGTMFVWAPLPTGYTDSEAFCMELLEHTGIIFTPGTSFGPSGQGYVRIALVQPVVELKRIVHILSESGILR